MLISRTTRRDCSCSSLLLLPSALSFANPRFDDDRREEEEEEEKRLFLLPIIATIGSFGTHLVIIIVVVFFEFDL